jgi:hypothetical protein
VGDVIGQGDRAVELPLAEADEGASLLDGAPVEAMEREERQDVDHARGLEHDLVAARLEVGGVGRVAGPARRLAPTAPPSRSASRTDAA